MWVAECQGDQGMELQSPKRAPSYDWFCHPFCKRHTASMEGYLGSITQKPINGMCRLPTFHFSELGRPAYLSAGETGTYHLVLCHHTHVINNDWTIILKRVLANRKFGF